MKLFSVTVENFRCYRQPFKMDFSNFTALIAKNDSGKSAILEALDAFFNEPLLESGDVSIGSTTDIKITCEFTEFPAKVIVDASNEINLSDEYLLNSYGRLEITKIFSGTKPKVKDIFIKALHPSDPNIKDLLQLTITQLKDRARALEVDLSTINSSIKAQIRTQIRKSLENLALAEQFIPVKEDDSKRIWDKLKLNMPLFALFKSDRASTDQDNEAQDPMKLAISEALSTKRNELDQLTEFVKEEVTKIANLTVCKLKEMDAGLANELKPNISEPKYNSIYKVSLTDDAQVPINKRGSGVRRLILLNFFRAKAELLATEKGATSIIYAVEEPETSQHPKNQILIMNALSELVDNDSCQVIISTHTPTLARLLPISSIRYIEKQDDDTRILCPNDDDTFQKIVKSLGILADHDIRLFIGVEGANDINFFRIISRLLSQTEVDIPNLGELENDGKILFIPLGGSNLALWTDRLKGLGRPEIHIFDRDTIYPNRPKYQDHADSINERVNCYAFITEKLEIENYLHPLAITMARPEVSITFGDFDDVPLLCAKQFHLNSESIKDWEDIDAEVIKKKTSSCKKWLNTKAVEMMTPELLSHSDPNDFLRNILRKISELLEFELSTEEHNGTVS